MRGETLLRRRRRIHISYILEVGVTSQPMLYIMIEPEKLRILRLDIWGTVSVLIVDLNADIRGGFTNLTANYQKLRLDIGVGI